MIRRRLGYKPLEADAARLRTLMGAEPSGSGSGPNDAQYLVLVVNADLTNERVFTAGDGIDTVDAGAGGAYTVSVDVTDIIGTDYGLTESGNDIRINAGDGLGFDAGALVVDLSGTSGLEFSGGDLQIADSIAGAGLTIASKVLAVGAGDGIAVAADSVAVDLVSAWSGLEFDGGDLRVDLDAEYIWTGLHTHEANVVLDDGNGDSPQLIFYGGSNDDAVIMRLVDDATGGDSDFKIQLCDDAGDSEFQIHDSGGATVWSINSDGNMTVVDNAWLGLANDAGRIEFDNQTTDEVNILGAYVGINTSTPGRPLAVVMDAPANTHTVAFIDSTAHIGVALGELDGEASIQGFDDDESAPDRWIDLVINKAGGDVGIGTTPNADRKLHVNSGATNVVAHFESSDNRALITFADDSTTNDNTSGIGTDADVLFLYAGGARQIFVNSDGDLMIGTTSSPTANGGAVLVFADNSNDPTMNTNTAGLYAKDVSGTVEIFCVDEADNVTQLSPHNYETGEWVFYSRNLRTGRELYVDMERLVKRLDALLGGGYVHDAQGVN